jgi:uncharacterized protein (TIGR03437 family)
MGGPGEPVLPASVSIGGLQSKAVFRGRVAGTAGVLQINARVPVGAVPGDGLPIVLWVGDKASLPLAVAVR